MAKNMVGESGSDTLLPNARIENLVIRELPDEVLVYDLKTNRAYCLNPSATLTWKHCDGKTSVADMTSILTAELKTQVDEDTVWLALKQLGKARLLEQPVVTPIGKPGLSRREVIRKLGLGAAIAAPLVMSIIAPTAASAATCKQAGGACTKDSDCCQTPFHSGCHANGNTTCCRNGGELCTTNSQCCSNNCHGSPLKC
jgi:hypothetical protein